MCDMCCDDSGVLRVSCHHVADQARPTQPVKSLSEHCGHEMKRDHVSAVKTDVSVQIVPATAHLDCGDDATFLPTLSGGLALSYSIQHLDRQTSSRFLAPFSFSGDEAIADRSRSLTPYRLTVSLRI